MILSVGCGGNKKYPHSSLGDVNIDLEFPVVEIRNFIRSDAHFLPFRRKIFSEVRAIHVAEHLDDPLFFLREAARVCNGKILIVVPHFLSWSAYADSTHKWVFVGGRFCKIAWFMRFLAKLLPIRIRRIREKFFKYVLKRKESVVIEFD